MYKLDFRHPCHIHFIGIGGISMSGFAKLLHHAGFTVSGSDGRRSPLTDELAAEGVKVSIGQRASNITEDIDVVVYTAAIGHDNPEFVEATILGLPMMDRAEMVGQVMKNYAESVAVAGTHGKTTTTSMLSHIMIEGEKDPTISVGGILPAIGGNLRIGHTDSFLIEACEYTNSFLKFDPKISVILNVDADHLDFFKDLDDIRHSFRLFAERLPEDGLLVIEGDIPNLSYFTDGLTCRRFVTFGRGEGPYDYTAADIVYDEAGCASYTLVCGGKPAERVTLHVVGDHNITNSLAAIAVADELGISREKTLAGLAAFGGTDRRFQHKGEVGGVTIVDDYAHHPTEIRATLKAVEHTPYKKVWCVFQPHTYSRTKELLHEFAEALSLADHVILAPIYAAREKDPGDISSADLQKLIAAKGVPCEYLTTFEQIEKFILKNCSPGDLLITMGAGDVVNIGEALVSH